MPWLWLGIGVLGLLALGSGGKTPTIAKQRRLPASTDRRSPIRGCHPFSWHPGEVDDATARAIEQYGLDHRSVTLAVAREVYPTMPDGQVREHGTLWPPHPLDCAELHMLWERLRLRVNRHTFAIADDMAGSAWRTGGGR